MYLQQWSNLLGMAADPAAPADLDAALSEAVELGHDIAPHVLGCSLTEIGDGGYQTTAASTSLALALDLEQYSLGNGPCIVAARSGQQQHVDTQRDAAHFDGFPGIALSRGVLSSYSVPLRAARRRTALNIYASKTEVLTTDRAQAVAALLGRCISTLLSEARRGDSSAEVVAARESGRLVRLARDRIGAAEQLSQAEAYDLLAQRASASNRSIIAVAREDFPNPGKEDRDEPAR